MILLSGFLDVLFRALVFVGLALGVGGIVFYYAVLRPLRPSDAILHRTATMIAVGAFTVAISQFAAVLTSLSTMAGPSGWPIAAFAQTDFARAGTVHATLALALGTAALFLRKHVRSAAAWGIGAGLGALVMVGGAWPTHGSSRLTNAAPLMAVTVIHQLAAVTWIGGTIALTAQWRLLRRQPRGGDMWSRIVGRFSPLALGSVVVLVAAGFYLSWEYIRGFNGLVGTAYGTMLLTKIALMFGLLLLGGINNLTIRGWKMTGSNSELLRRVPVFAEVEAGIGVIVLMAAAALTAQPPAIDTVTQQATPAQVLHVFAAKMPQLVPPPRAEMLAEATSSTDPFALPNRISELQSDFNHNISGIFVILIGLGAFTSAVTRWRWARHWPLIFIPFALFLVAAGEPNGWPLGPEPFWGTLIAPEVLQHRLATLLVVVLGLVEWRVTAGGLASTRWSYVFPILLLAGGGLLLTHSHSVFSITWAFLIEVSHNAIGVLAVFAGAGAWIQLKLPDREGRIAGIIWPVCLTLIGIVLLFYREI